MSDSIGAFAQQIANPKVVNPLAEISQANQAAKGFWDVQQQRANQALGQAYQGAIDQNTGVLDPNKFRTLVAQNPMAAMNATLFRPGHKSSCEARPSCPMRDFLPHAKMRTFRSMLAVAITQRICALSLLPLVCAAPSPFVCASRARLGAQRMSATK